MGLVDIRTKFLASNIQGQIAQSQIANLTSDLASKQPYATFHSQSDLNIDGSLADTYYCALTSDSSMNIGGIQIGKRYTFIIYAQVAGWQSITTIFPNTNYDVNYVQSTVIVGGKYIAINLMYDGTYRYWNVIKDELPATTNTNKGKVVINDGAGYVFSKLRREVEYTGYVSMFYNGLSQSLISSNANMFDLSTLPSDKKYYMRFVLCGDMLSYGEYLFTISKNSNGAYGQSSCLPLHHFAVNYNYPVLQIYDGGIWDLSITPSSTFGPVYYNVFLEIIQIGE